MMSAIFIVIGFGGFLTLGRNLAGYILAHNGALGVMGLFGFLAGSRASRKGINYWTAFSWAFFLPILVGIVGAALLVPDDKPGIPLSCGGLGSLVVGVIVVLFFSLKQKKN